MEYLILFLMSLAASLHCVGMCGGIAAMHDRWTVSNHRKRFYRFLYHGGRIGTYLCLGGFFGALGALSQGAQRGLALITGTFIVWTAVQALSPSPSGGLALPGTFFGSLFAAIRSRPGGIGSLCFGIFHGLLPCSLVYAFAAKAASSGSIPSALLTMIAFGLGTVPALLFSSSMIQRLSPRLRLYAVSAGSLSILFLGVVTLLRGFSPLHAGHG
ncbi:MAG: sulfite exporter TauE/SafE family protein [Nitrospirae bacterium]|nr:sulfite exporter TauE/SafE family protein [Candidatus Manganitrophaceae bacterium]